MAFNNFNSRHFTAQEETDLLAALATLEAILGPKLASLTKVQRNKFGSIDEQNKLIVNKAKDSFDDQPELAAPEVAWPEFLNDFKSRRILESIIKRINNLLDGLSSAKMLHDYDNLKDARTDKKYADYKVESGDASYKAKADDYARLTKRGPNKTDNSDSEIEPSE